MGERAAAAGRRILVVEDDAGQRALMRAILNRIGEVVEASDGETALAAAQSSPPALVVLDVCLPGLGGYETCRELRERFGDELPIIFVSGERTDPYDRTAGLLLGADDYVVKPFDPDELLTRVRRLLARRTTRAAEATEADDGFAELTPREVEVLALLADGLAQEDIARELVISPRTVATHIQHVLAKLGVHSRAQAVALAYRRHASTADRLEQLTR
jgi:DNA-binding NarL/FixJ family response regulator